MAKGEVPLLGFEAEYHNGWDVLHVPVKHYGVIAVYAWHKNVGEGYNVFFPNDIAPFKVPIAGAYDPFMVKIIIQDYLNKINHFVLTGELPTEVTTNDHQDESLRA